MDSKQITSYIIQNIHEIPVSVLNVLVQQLPEEEKAKVKDAINALESDERYRRGLGNVRYDYTTYEFKEEVFPKNETIETLLRWFNNPKCKKVQQARWELRRRFPYQTYSQQRKIMDAIMHRGSKIDVKWAVQYLQHDMFWKDEYLNTVISVWKTENLNWKFAQIISTRATIDYVRELADSCPLIEEDAYGSFLYNKNVSQSNIYSIFATRVAKEDSQFVIDKNKLMPMQYIFTCAKVNRKVTHNEAIDGFFSCMAISLNRIHWMFDNFDDCMRNIKKIKYFFHYLRDLEMFQEIIQCNDWIMDVSATIRSKMVERYGENILQKHRLSEEQEKYKTYLHQSIISQQFPNDYKDFLEVDYSNFTFESWKEKFDIHQDANEGELLPGLIDITSFSSRLRDVTTDAPFSMNDQAPF